VLVSPNGRYVVRLSGHVTKPIIFEHPVRAEVYKDGVLHVPARQIYVSDVFEAAFQDRYAPPQWIGTNVVRFAAKRRAADQGTDGLTVRNAGPQPLRCVRIETGTDMFMIVDLDSRAEVVLSLTADRRPRRLTWFDVVVDSGDARSILRGNGAFRLERTLNGPHEFMVAVTPNGIEVGESTGRADLFR
jgi:hypothetical protein